MARCIENDTKMIHYRSEKEILFINLAFMATQEGILLVAMPRERPSHW